jgi:hypothetical protein
VCKGFPNWNEICVGSTFEIILGNFLTIMNITMADELGFYGVDITNSQATPMGASTLWCMDMEKEEYNVRASSITKSYTMFATICIICNVNKSKLVLQVCPIYHNFFELLTFLVIVNS